jgi:hypothetical protein
VPGEFLAISLVVGVYCSPRAASRGLPKTSPARARADPSSLEAPASSFPPAKNSTLCLWRGAKASVVLINLFADPALGARAGP